MHLVMASVLRTTSSCVGSGDVAAPVAVVVTVVAVVEPADGAGGGGGGGSSRGSA